MRKILFPVVMAVTLLFTTAVSTQVAEAKTWTQYFKPKKKRTFFKQCRKSHRFNERQARFSHATRLAGRCLAGKKFKYASIGTYGSHHPSPGRAIDVMVNHQGSCTLHKKWGHKIASHFMKHARKYNVYYIVWRGKYWNANIERPKPPHTWRRGGGSGGCTHSHKDHVHIAFNS